MADPAGQIHRSYTTPAIDPLNDEPHPITQTRSYTSEPQLRPALSYPGVPKQSCIDSLIHRHISRLTSQISIIQGCLCKKNPTFREDKRFFTDLLARINSCFPTYLNAYFQSLESILHIWQKIPKTESDFPHSIWFRLNPQNNLEISFTRRILYLETPIIVREKWKILANPDFIVEKTVHVGVRSRP